MPYLTAIEAFVFGVAIGSLGWAVVNWAHWHPVLYVAAVVVGLGMIRLYWLFWVALAKHARGLFIAFALLAVGLWGAAGYFAADYLSHHDRIWAWFGAAVVALLAFLDRRHMFRNKGEMTSD